MSRERSRDGQAVLTTEGRLYLRVHSPHPQPPLYYGFSSPLCHSACPPAWHASCTHATLQSVLPRSGSAVSNYPMSRYLEAVRKAADLQSALNEVGDNNDRSRLLEELSWAYYIPTHAGGDSGLPLPTGSAKCISNERRGTELVCMAE